MSFRITLLPLIFNKILLDVNGHMFMLSRQALRKHDKIQVYYWVCWRQCGACFQTTIVNGKHEKDVYFLNTVVHTHTDNLFENREEFQNLMRDGEILPHPSDDSIEQIHNYSRQKQPNVANGRAITMEVSDARNPSTSINASSQTFDPFAYQQFPGLPADFEKTLSGQQFYIKDTGTDRDRIVILSTIENLEYLSESSFWLVSGAYKNPSLGRHTSNFIQVYTIHGDIKIGPNKLCMPLVFALFMYPTEATYRTMFTQLNEFALQQRIDFSRNTRLQIVSDLNVFAFNALKSVFPFATHTVSFYHFSQNIHNQMQFEGMPSKNISEQHFNFLRRHMPALAYLPSSKIVDGWEIIKQMMINECTGCENLANNFEISFVTRIVFQYGDGEIDYQQLPPLFDPQSWSISTSVDAEYIRSTVAEAWNHRLEKSIYRQSGLYNLISQLQHVQNETEYTITQTCEGMITFRDPSDVRLEDIKKKIRELEVNENSDILEFLKSVSYNINFKGDYAKYKFNTL